MKRKISKVHADPHMHFQARKNGPLEGWKPGDRVAYTAAFCRQIGMIGGDRRGTIVKQHEEVSTWIVVQWDDASESEPVSSCALAFWGSPSIRLCEAL